VRAVVAVVLAWASVAAAQVADGPRPIVGFSVRGHSKRTDKTAEYLSHVSLGERITARDIPRIAEALLSSELFETVAVTLEDAPGGVLVVATLEDKHSWVIAPTLFLLSGNQAVGVGFAENNFRGKNQKLLVYGQIGTRESLFFGTFLNPSLAGTPLTYRIDLYAYRRGITEYTNPTDDAGDASIARITTTDYLGGGALVGYRIAWWLTADLRFRGAYVNFRETHTNDDAQTPQPIPETDGWDVSVQPRLTLDGRHHRFGVTWGPYVQLILDGSIPGLDDYDYSSALIRAYYSWRFFDEHQLELRAGFGAGKHLPLHEELTLGGAVDLRGYAVDRFRGDVRSFGRAEYSVPMFKWKFFAFRAIGFWDTGTVGFHNPRTGGDRTYLLSQHEGIDRWRNDLGLGLRIYVKAIVLPLLGFDVGYGLEGKSPAVYFEVGLTDF
jgi:outer membrane protein assembly factor BamA